MFSVDERTGNVITTFALYAAAAAILYMARTAILVCVVALLFAYLLEPLVNWVERHLTAGASSRARAIAVLYSIGVLFLGSLGYAFGPQFVAQIKNLVAMVPAPSARPLQFADVWANPDLIARVFERGAASAALAVSTIVWLVAIPIVAMFFLSDGRRILSAIPEVAPRNRPLVQRIADRVDEMLARYVRARTILAGLSFAFYSVSTAILGFPYVFALGLLGGVLEFLPTLGWIASAVVIIAVGVTSHSHWIWMLALLVLWRILQIYVNIPSRSDPNAHFFRLVHPRHAGSLFPLDWTLVSGTDVQSGRFSGRRAGGWRCLCGARWRFYLWGGYRPDV